MAPPTARLTAFFFDIDDTLYNSTRQSTYARFHAIEAMIDSGLSAKRQDVERTLQEVIREFGSNYTHHYDEMLRRLGAENVPHLVAAGIVAYHAVKLAYLRPFEETIPSLLRLRDRGYKLGIVTNGVAVKQWEKLIRLGLQHFFHGVVISGDIGVEKPDPAIFLEACRRLGVAPGESAYVGNDPRSDIAGANGVGMVSIRIRQGKHAELAPASAAEVADHDIESLRQVVDLVKAGVL